MVPKMPVTFKIAQKNDSYIRLTSSFPNTDALKGVPAGVDRFLQILENFTNLLPSFRYVSCTDKKARGME